MNSNNEQQIINSWKKNVQPWIRAVREGEIESRLQVTNQAIINAIFEQSPKTVLDIGCGEGWLSRELTISNISSFGIDAVPAFIESARKESLGTFKILSTDDLVKGVLKEKFDVIVCNFSLFGDESVLKLFQYIPQILNSGGSFIIQTIHPKSSCGDEPYKNDWRKGSWRGFHQQFQDPAPWFFRTITSWENLFSDSGCNLNKTFEPINPNSQSPASIIFVGTT